MSGVLISREDGVAVVQINLPEQRNALSNEVLAQLVGHLEELDRDRGVRCIVIAGSDKVFASGADIRALSALSPTEIYEGDRARSWELLRRVRTPLIAAVSGLCLGGGCELAMQADILIASETARFGLPETGLGLLPGAGGTQALPRAIGKAKAMDVILSGRLLSAEEAERAGLVSRVVGAGEWFAVAREVAAQVSERPEVAVTLAKEAVIGGLEVGLQAGIGIERRAFAIAFGTPDAREGLAAFIEKRPPRWERDSGGEAGKSNDSEEDQE